MKRGIVKFFRNKYVIVLSLNLIYLLFIHNINLFYIVRSKWEADHLKSEIEMMKKKNADIQEDYLDITTNARTLEKYAREQFYMRRDQEEVFIIKAE